jgi:hypothetical protein
VKTTAIAFTPAERNELSFELLSLYERASDDNTLIDNCGPTAFFAMLEGLAVAIHQGVVATHQAQMLLDLVLNNDIMDGDLATSLEEKLRAAAPSISH